MTSILPSPGHADEKFAELQLLAGLRERLSKITFSGIGQVEAIVTAPKHGEHVLMTEARVIPGVGVEGDRPYKQYWRGRLMPGRQISVMSAEVLDALSVNYDVPGDNLIVRGIDLRQIAKGDALRVGDAVLIATGAAHNPCKLFVRRTSTAHYVAVREHGLRGAMFDALDAATIRVGDAVERIVLG